MPNPPEAAVDWKRSAFILLAGGGSTRMAKVVEDKTLMPLAGEPVFLHSLRAWNLATGNSPVVLVFRDEEQRSALREALEVSGFSAANLHWAAGGEQREDSVRSGLQRLPTGTEFVFIHDAARPLLQGETLRNMARLLPVARAVVCARPATDTIHQAPKVKAEHSTHWTPLNRSELWTMETPQAFSVDLLKSAHREAKRKHQSLTDDVAALALQGIPVAPYVPTHPNPKLTHPDDIPWIEYLMTTRSTPEFRIGQGFDIHIFAPGRKLVLGGVEIPHHEGLNGHSDADCLTHALADAVLGACGLPDIGHFFPNNDPDIEGIDSQKILQRAVAEAKGLGWSLVNTDLTVLAEKPKIGPYIDAMKAVLGANLELSSDRIGIKATTLEKVGGLGRGEGIAAQAVVLLQRV